MDQAGPPFPAEIHQAPGTADVDILNFRALGEMLHHGCAVKHRVNGEIIGHIPGHIARDNAQPAAEQVGKSRAEVIKKQRLQPVLRLLRRFATDKTVDGLRIGVDEFFQYMNAEKSRAARQQHVAQSLAFSLSEGVEGISAEQGVDGAVVVVAHFIIASGGAVAGNEPCELSGRGIGKDIAIGHVHAGLVGLDNDPCHHERSTAQFKEIVGSPHAVRLQDVRENVAQGALGVAHRFRVGAADGQFGLGKGLHVRLAVGRHGHFVQLQIGGGHHVWGKALGNFCFQGIGRDGAASRVVGAQMIFAAQLADDDDHLLHAVHLEHHVFYFTKFDAQSAQFYLVVRAAQDNHVAVGRPFGVVARAIHPFAAIFDEAFTCHLLQTVISPGHAAASDVEFPDHADGQFIAVAIDDKLFDPQLRAPHRDRRGAGQFLIVGGNCNFRWPVAIEYAGRCDGLELLQQAVGEFFATGPDNTDAGDGAGKVVAREPRLPA